MHNTRNLLSIISVLYLQSNAALNMQNFLAAMLDLSDGFLNIPTGVGNVSARDVYFAQNVVSTFLL